MFCLPRRLEKKQIITESLSKDSQILLSDWMQKPSSYLIIHGKESHCSDLAAGVMNYFERVPTKRYTTEADFIAHLREDPYLALDRVNYLAQSDLFILDDWTNWVESDWEIKMVRQFLRKRFDNLLPTILASKGSLHEVKANAQEVFPGWWDDEHIKVVNAGSGL